MSAEQEVRKASQQFYAALNRMANGDSGGMADIWSRTASVTTMHPIGGREVGWDVLDAYVRQWFDYSEERMKEVIRAIPRGRLTRSSRHDPFPGTPDDGVEIKVIVDVDPEAAMIDVDLTDNPDCMANGINLSEGCARSAPTSAIPPSPPSR